MDQLIVVAGPKCVGKTTVINRCKEGQSDLLKKNFGVENRLWDYLTLNEIDNGAKINKKNIVLHYDFIRAIIRGHKGYKNDSIIKYINQAKQVKFITLWSYKKEMINRIEERIDNCINHSIKNMNERQNIFKIKMLNWVKSLYESETNLWRIYVKWWQFSMSIESKHWLLLNDKNLEKLQFIQSIDDVEYIDKLI